MENIHEISDCHVININEISECHAINVHEISECHAINVKVEQRTRDPYSNSTVEMNPSNSEMGTRAFIPGMLRTNIFVSGLSGLDVVNNVHFRGGLIFTIANMDSHTTRVLIGCGIITGVIAIIYYIVNIYD